MATAIRPRGARRAKHAQTHVETKGHLRRRRVWIVEQLTPHGDKFVSLDESRRFAAKFVHKMNRDLDSKRSTFALRAGWIVYKTARGVKGGDV